MNVTNATNFRKNLFSYIEAAAVNDDKIIITTKNGNAAIISEEYLRNLEETCYLLSVPGMKQIIEEGINTPVEECEKIDWEKDFE